MLSPIHMNATILVGEIRHMVYTLLSLLAKPVWEVPSLCDFGIPPHGDLVCSITPQSCMSTA